MAKKKNGFDLNGWLAYAAVRVVAVILRILPLPAAAAVGRGIGALLYRFDKRHRKLAVSQIMNAYSGSVSEEEALAITRDMYRHLGDMLAEFVRIPSLNAENIDKFVDWRGSCETLRAVMEKGKGVILASGHIGNWEMAGTAFAIKGLNSGAVARPLDNPYLNRFIKNIRQRSGQEIWDKYGVLRQLVRVLREGRGFGILVDQDAGQRGLFVPFFGIKASAIPTPVDLALLTGSPVIAIGVHRTGDPMNFAVKFRPPRWPDLKADKEKERVRLLCQINADLESIIREVPSQWLWIHRRWKTRPPKES